MRRTAQQIVLAIAALACVLAFSSLAAACPSCKAALANSEKSGGDLVSGFFWSILFMMSMPFAILGGFSSYFYLLVRRARRERQSASQQSATETRSES